MTERQIWNLALACHEIQRSYNELCLPGNGIFDYEDKGEWDSLDLCEQIATVEMVQKVLDNLEAKPLLKHRLFTAIIRATVRINKR